MKICLLSKYPPIEGGVSVRNYWMARGLAARGHQVFVVTNASEVEDAFRMHLTEADEPLIQPEFEASGGFVRLVQMPATTLKYRYIPWANPFVSRLASLACRAVREYGCEAIYSYYFEPYGVAAQLASLWTGVPYIIKHAGSDLGRLMELPDLRTTYEEILKGAGLIVTDPRHEEPFAALGVNPDRIFTDLVFSLPTDLFHPGAPAMDVAGVLQSLGSSHPSAGRPTPWRTDEPDPSIPSIGIYGKVGDIKGSYDLLNALSRLRSKGLEFNLLAMTHGWDKREDLFHRTLEEQGLTKNTWILPFLPPWRVPGFIRRCTAVCFLERNFPIAGHAPGIPQEILACGTCLIVSLEIAKRPMYRHRLADGVNALVVRDPRDAEELATALELVVTRPARAAQLGAAGHKASTGVAPESAFIDSVEAMFRRLADLRDEKKPGSPGAHAGEIAVLRARMPWTSLLLAENLEWLWGRCMAEKGPVTPESETAEWFSAFLNERIEAGALDLPYLREVLRYELMCLTDAESNPRVDDYEPVIYRARPLVNNGFELSGALKPFLFPHVRIESFEYDMEQLIGYLDQGQVPSSLPRSQSVVVFQPAGCRNFQVSPACADLMPMLDGQESIGRIVAHFASRYGLESETDKRQLADGIRAFLREMLETGVIGVKP